MEYYSAIKSNKPGIENGPSVNIMGITLSERSQSQRFAVSLHIERRCKGMKTKSLAAGVGVGGVSD